MNVVKLSADTLLEPLTRTSQAEGFEFVKRLGLELTNGDFDRPGTVLFGRFVEAELVGVGGLTADLYPDAAPGVGRLRHLYVLTQYRRLGIGQELVTSLVEEARLYYRILRLRTTTPEAARFYEVLDFHPCTEPDATHLFELR